MLGHRCTFKSENRTAPEHEVPSDEHPTGQGTSCPWRVYIYNLALASARLQAHAQAQGLRVRMRERTHAHDTYTCMNTGAFTCDTISVFLTSPEKCEAADGIRQHKKSALT